MEVYGDGCFWNEQKNGELLEQVIIGKSFVWEDLEGFVPALYTGSQGVVLDLCIRIPVEKIETFLKKWNQEERLSGLSDEEYEQMAWENPTSLNAFVALRINGAELVRQQLWAVGWHPLEIERECIEDTAEEWMRSYACDRECGWLFQRCYYVWKEERIFNIKCLELTFQEMKHPVTAAHFCTEGSCLGQKITVRHPVTQKPFEITLHDNQAKQLNEDVFRQQNDNLEYPAFYRILTYSVKPESGRELITIQDCARSDPPMDRSGERKKNRAVSVIAGESGSTAVFLAGKSPDAAKKAAMSSLHFVQTEKTEWRVVFQLQRRQDWKWTVDFSE